MNKLFIYYSNTGNGEIVAYKMESLGYEVRRVIPKKELPKSFFFKVMAGGFLAGIGAKPKLLNFDLNIDNYDDIVIGSPIWNGRLSCPINTVLTNLNLETKKVQFVLYSGSGEAKKANKQIAKYINNPNIIILKEPKKYPDELDKLM